MKRFVEFSQFKPDKNSPVALHQQLSNELLRQLRALPPCENYTLPSERSLVRQLEINRLTVHRAYSDLLDKNLVIRNADKSLSVAPSARKKLQGSFPVIGVVLPEKFSIYSRQKIAMEYLRGIIDRATEKGISIIMLTPPEPDADARIVQEFISKQCSKLTGIIHLGLRRTKENDHTLETLFNYSGVPQIFISGRSKRSHIGCIYSEQESGLRELCAEMIRKNCKTAGILSFGNAKTKVFDYNFHYRVGLAEKIFRENGLEITSKIPVREKTDIILPARLPDVFWCCNDEYAIALIKQLQTRGVKVPQDVKVAGFDGLQTDCDGIKLSTIAQNFCDIGSGAVDLVLEHFNHGATSENKILEIPTTYIPGDTL